MGQAKEPLTSSKDLHHRNMRPIEPEAIFGQIKHDGLFRRFHYRGQDDMCRIRNSGCRSQHEEDNLRDGCRDKKKSKTLP